MDSKINDSILKRILNLLNRNEKNGATKAEAEIALAKAGELMTQYNITEFDLKKVDTSSFKRMEIKFKRQSITDLLTYLARTFDCVFTYKSVYNIGYFFGFELDVKICVHFAKMLDSILESEIREYKKSYEYYKLKWNYQPTAIIKNFVAGFTEIIDSKLKLIEDSRKIKETSNGTSLMVIKKKEVDDEFKKRYDVKYVDSPETVLILQASTEGVEQGKKVNLNTPIEQPEELVRIGENK